MTNITWDWRYFNLLTNELVEFTKELLIKHPKIKICIEIALEAVTIPTFISPYIKSI